MDWIPETPVLTHLQQTVVDGYPRPNLPLFRNSRSSLCSSVFGAIFQELFDFEGDMRLTYTVWLQARAWRVEICQTTLKPWSDWIELGRPTGGKSLVKALTITFALIFLKGMASGNLLDAHMMVIKYWCPDLFLGSGFNNQQWFCWMALERLAVTVTVLLEWFDSVSQPSNRVWNDLQYYATTFLRLSH